MRVKQSPLLEKLREKPAELQKLFDALHQNSSRDAETPSTPPTITLDGKDYVVRRSPVITERTGY